MKTKKLIQSHTDLIALLAACCLFLSTIEHCIPKPLPFLRIGLANLPILVALQFLPPLPYLLLLCFKTGIQALVNGSLFSYTAVLSAGSTFSSGFIMMISYRLLKRYISLVGVSILGAISSTITQLLLAGILLFGDAVRLIGPPFLIMGLVSGFLLGLFIEIFSRRSEWIRLIKTTFHTERFNKA
jgi:heptaprenyl diphosphate synthase